MASAVQRQHPFWDLVPLELLALGLSTLLIAISPLGGVDHWFYAHLLRMTGKSAPTTRVVVVLVDAEHIRGNDCSRALPELAARGKAESALLLPPLDELCARSGRITRLTENELRRDADGRVIGFSPLEPKAVPLESARWVAPRPWASVPEVSAGDLDGGRVSTALLAGKVVLFGLEHPPLRRRDAAVGPLSAETGAALGAALEDRPRRVAPTLVAVLAGGLILAEIAFRRRKPGHRLAPSWLVPATALALAVETLFAAFGFGYLLPLPSLGVIASLFVGLTALPALVAAQRARVGASRVLGEAQSLAAHAAYLSDQDFWTRMVRRVEQTHAADGVLVAELPPFSWRLRVWPNGDLNESIIKERRRDVRRTPFVDDAGSRRAHIVDGFLVMSGTPCVFAPLEASGELEGYLILIGKPAAHAFVERPQATERLADEVALLIRNRRLERTRADAWRRPAGMLVENPAKWSENLLDQARSATEGLELLQELFRAAPVGLLYADAFGDVRLLGRELTEQLKIFGVSLPDASSAGSIPPGRLTLAKLLSDVSRLSGRAAPNFSDITPQGISLELTLESGQLLELLLQRLEVNGEPSGFLATLIAIDRSADAGAAPEGIQRMPERGDPLTVFSLAELVSETVDAIARDIQVKLRFQTPRETGHVIGHRRELGDALAAFLVDVARSAPSSAGPVLTLRERGQWVELSLIDLKLGVPESAMQRTVVAPSVPPPGLEPLARFVRAIEESHGRVRVKGEESWGVKLTIGLVRARPRVQPTALGRILRFSDAPVSKRRP